mmetsp:Transcript_32368/g.73925  ORF Transcript_32368/g.73925 Transcript_32368/m.73925 type:complete len:200 (+) Transcript_32368:928-1527(+)
MPGPSPRRQVYRSDAPACEFSRQLGGTGCFVRVHRRVRGDHAKAGVHGEPDRAGGGLERVGAACLSRQRRELGRHRVHARPVPRAGRAGRSRQRRDVVAHDVPSSQRVDAFGRYGPCSLSQGFTAQGCHRRISSAPCRSSRQRRGTGGRLQRLQGGRQQHRFQRSPTHPRGRRVRRSRGGQIPARQRPRGRVHNCPPTR